MKSVIKKLWYGNINPQENLNINDNPELRQLTEYMVRHMKELKKTLTDEQKELFEKYTDNRNEYESLYHAEIFAHALKLGAKILA